MRSRFWFQIQSLKLRFQQFFVGFTGAGISPKLVAVGHHLSLMRSFVEMAFRGVYLQRSKLVLFYELICMRF